MFTLCFIAYVILIRLHMHSLDVGLVVTLVWPPKSLRSQKVALGRKRLYTTDISYTCAIWYLYQMLFKVVISVS